MRYYLGLDNGGTNTKAALFNIKGEQIAVESIETGAITPAPDFVERDMDQMWADNCKVIKGLIEKIETKFVLIDNKKIEEKEFRNLNRPEDV